MSYRTESAWNDEEEIDREVELWEPVAEFIEKLFEENIMDKKFASKIINNNLGINKLKPTNNGNVKFANKSKVKDVYWLNIHIDDRLSNEYHIILNNSDEQKFIHLIIPPNTFNTNIFHSRLDNTNGLDKFDIEVSLRELLDVKSGGTSFNFKEFVNKVYPYS